MMFKHRCVMCRAFKASELGTLKRGSKYNTTYFVCHACGEKPKRVNRVREESPPERDVREALCGCGFQVLGEFKLGKFFYDFGVPKLRMLLEIDSFTYHSSGWKLKRDRLKSSLAKQAEYLLVRLRPGPRLREAAIEAVRDRAIELGFR